MSKLADIVKEGLFAKCLFIFNFMVAFSGGTSINDILTGRDRMRSNGRSSMIRNNLNKVTRNITLSEIYIKSKLLNLYLNYRSTLISSNRPHEGVVLPKFRSNTRIACSHLQIFQ